MSVSSVLRVQEDSALVKEFSKLAKSVSMYLSCEGAHVRPHLEGLPYFSKLSLEAQQVAVDRLRFYHDLCADQSSEGYRLRDSKTFTWRALSKLGLVPKSDLFMQMTDDHIVEVYSSENIQLFRNLNFFDFCSYSLEELHAIEWWGLFDREAATTQKLFGYAEKIFSGELSENFKPEVEKHILRETNSFDRLSMEYAVELMGPLYNSRRPQALVILESARLLSNH